MKKIFLSVSSILVVGAIAFIGTRAYFTDIETSPQNQFESGELDLKIDNVCSMNDSPCDDPFLSWTFTDGDLVSQKFFDFGELVPGDWGKDKIGIQSDSEIFLCMTIDNLIDKEQACKDPEYGVESPDCGGTGNGSGEIGDKLYVFAWRDYNHNGSWDAGEPKIFPGGSGKAKVLFDGVTYSIADMSNGDSLGGGTTDHIGLQWCLGTMTVNDLDNTITCSGAGAGNEVQTDYLSADISFHAVQADNNDGFLCSDL